MTGILSGYVFDAIRPWMCVKSVLFKTKTTFSFSFLLHKQRHRLRWLRTRKIKDLGRSIGVEWKEIGLEIKKEKIEVVWWNTHLNITEEQGPSHGTDDGMAHCTDSIHGEGGQLFGHLCTPVVSASLTMSLVPIAIRFGMWKQPWKLPWQYILISLLH